MPTNVTFLHDFFFKFHALIALFFLGGFAYLILIGIKKGCKKQPLGTNWNLLLLFWFKKVFPS